MVEKVIKDGKVAVLVSPGFGAGWTTWEYGNDQLREFMMFDKSLVDIVGTGNAEDAETIIKTAGFEPPYMGGWRDICIEWIDRGSAFQITEYDGSESLETQADTKWSIA